MANNQVYTEDWCLESLQTFTGQTIPYYEKVRKIFGLEQASPPKPL